MSTKTYVWIGLFIGSAIGGYIPALWGASLLTYTSAILSAVGGLAGIWLGFKIGNN